MKIVSLFLCIVAIYGYCECSEDAFEYPSLLISIKCTDTIFYPLLPIEICYKIKNLDDTTFYFIGDFDDLIQMMHIEDSKSRRYYCVLSSYSLGKCSLLVKQEFDNCNSITSYYQIKEPETYSCYLNFMDIYKSNTINIEVSYPRGDDSLAWIKFRDAKDLVFAGGDASVNKQKAYDLFLEIVDKYPESVYAPYALRDAFFRSIIMDRQTVQDKSKEYIEAGITGKLLDICLESIVATSVMLGDRASGETYLQSIIDQNSNSAKADRAKYWLDDLRKRPERK
ncbi:MAG: hypothetical protein R3F48_13315 [Candidatus Zixiibacteriota bacterium]